MPYLKLSAKEVRLQNNNIKRRKLRKKIRMNLKWKMMKIYRVIKKLTKSKRIKNQASNKC